LQKKLLLKRHLLLRLLLKTHLPLRPLLKRHLPLRPLLKRHLLLKPLPKRLPQPTQNNFNDRGGLLPGWIRAKKARF
jgi:hypothetical protein